MPGTDVLTFAADEAKIRYREPYVSEALNRKLANVLPRGTYRGFRLAPNVAALHLDIVADPTALDHISITETADGHALTVQKQGGNFTIDMTAFALTTQVVTIFGVYNTLSTTTVTIRMYLLADFLALGAADLAALVVLGTVVVPAAGVIPAANVTYDRRTPAWTQATSEALEWPALVRNPSFEASVELSTFPYATEGWQASGSTANGTYSTVVDLTVPEGAKALSVASVAGAFNGNLTQFLFVPIKPGRVVRLRFWKKNLKLLTGGSMSVDLYWGDPDGVPLITSTTINQTGIDAGYVYVERFITVPATAYFLIGVAISANGTTVAAPGEVIRIDDVQVWMEPGSNDVHNQYTTRSTHAETFSAVLLRDMGNYSDLFDQVALLRFDLSSPAGEGSLVLERGDQTTGLPPAFRMKGRLHLGESLISTIADAMKERIQITRAAAGVSSRTLIMLLDGGSGGDVRLYRVITGGFDGYEMTVNARWDEAGALWHNDANAPQSFRLQVTSEVMHAQVHHSIGGAQTWADGAWISDAQNDTDFEVAGRAAIIQNGRVIFTSPQTAGLNPSNIASVSTPTQNALYAKNIPKCWGMVSTDGLGAVVVDEGFNISSVTLPGGNLMRVTFAQAMQSANYAAVACIVSNTGFMRMIAPTVRTTNHVDFYVSAADGTTAINPAAEILTYSFHVHARQG